MRSKTVRGSAPLSTPPAMVGFSNEETLDVAAREARRRSALATLNQNAGIHSIGRSISAPTPGSRAQLPNFSRPFTSAASYRTTSVAGSSAGVVPKDETSVSAPATLPYSLQYLQLRDARIEELRRSETEVAAFASSSSSSSITSSTSEKKSEVGRSKSNVLRKRPPPSTTSRSIQSIQDSQQKRLRRASAIIVRDSIDASCLGSGLGSGFGRLVRKLTTRRAGSAAERQAEVDRQRLKRRIGTPSKRDGVISPYSSLGMRPVPVGV